MGQTRDNILRGYYNQRAGARSEYVVASDLMANGHFGLVQQRSHINVKCKKTNKFKRIYNKKQGCDIVGNREDGKAIYIEVKAINTNSLGLGSHIKQEQIDFLISRAKSNALAIIAWIKQNHINYICAQDFIKYLHQENRKSLPWVIAQRINLGGALSAIKN